MLRKIAIASEELNNLIEVLGGHHTQPFHHTRFRHVVCGNYNTFEPSFPCGQSDGKGSSHRTNVALQAQLTDQDKVAQA